ncbi:MAG: AAA family ATPase [Methanobacteriota archaeon]|nr:MAG: AAA family ATPase [Euryarchaeota archaeon]
MSTMIHKVRAYTHVFFAKDRFANSFITYIAALASFAALPFFPIYTVFLFAFIPAYITYTSKPEYGIVLLAFMNLFTSMYQSTIFGYVYLLAFSIILFKVWTAWKEIAFLHIVIFLPFAAFPFSLLGGFFYLIMLLASLHLGSHRSFLLSMPAIALVLLLSSLWGVPNDAYLPLHLNIYQPIQELQRATFPSLLDFFSIAIPTAFYNMFNFGNALGFSKALSIVSSNLTMILFNDGGILQLVFWAFLLYAVAFITGMSRSKDLELKSGLLLFAVPLVYFFIYSLLSLRFPWEIAIYSVASYGIFYYLEREGFTFSRERIERAERRSSVFSSLGLQDLSSTASVSGLDDVAGYDDVKDELLQAIKIPLEKPELAYTYGLKPPKGILLFGPPGTGKSYLMKAFAKELKYPLLYIKTSDILSPYYGESEKKISEIFKIARKKAPVILFFDEIDAIGKKRGASSMDDVTPRILNTLLQELDGVAAKEPIIFVAATNVPNLLDKALLRPGRIDKVIYMGVPDKEDRKEIFAYYLKDLPTQDIDLDKLAKESERYTPADIANVVMEAKREAAKRMARTGKVAPITGEDIMRLLKTTKPSTGISQLEMYKRFKLDFERRSGAVSKKPEKKAVTFDDVADMEDVKAILKEAIELPLLHSEEIEEFEVQPPKGLLLFGPPGTGKTYIVKAAAGTFNIPFIFLSGAELLKKGYGGAAEVLKEAFNRAKDNAPAIIFIDELETVAPARTGGANPLMGQLLQELDGVKDLKNVLVIGATNLPQSLDPALLRPGRFDKIVYVPQPNKEVREEMFKLHLGKFSSVFNIEELASMTEGFSAADIKAITDELKLALLQMKISGKGRDINKILSAVMEGRKPSITQSMLTTYKRFMEEYGERK